MFVLIRPGAEMFLRMLADYFELVIYTASLSVYADPLMDMLDPEKLCTNRLFREHCTQTSSGAYAKDLT